MGSNRCYFLVDDDYFPTSAHIRSAIFQLTPIISTNGTNHYRNCVEFLCPFDNSHHGIPFMPVGNFRFSVPSHLANGGPGWLTTKSIHDE